MLLFLLLSTFSIFSSIIPTPLPPPTTTILLNTVLFLLLSSTFYVYLLKDSPRTKIIIFVSFALPLNLIWWHIHRHFVAPRRKFRFICSRPSTSAPVAAWIVIDPEKYRIYSFHATLLSNSFIIIWICWIDLSRSISFSCNGGTTKLRGIFITATTSL